MLETLRVDESTSAAFGRTSDEVLIDSPAGSSLRRLRFHAALPGFKDAVTRVGFHPGGELVLAAGADGTIRGLKLVGLQQVYSAQHGAPIADLAVRGDGQLLASAGEDQVVKLWNAATGAPAAPAVLTGFSAPVHSVAFSRDGQRLAAAAGG